ncbi:MAG: hypothetical protein PCFJNLEI_00953 [Verrucomicrobiae bacterium]|nr:hypothetical protein [Verrucomicrobiae bacterium]
MFGQARLNELRARKELLVMQADAQRQLIALDAASVAHALRWADIAASWWQRIKPFAWVAAPVAGYCVVRHGRSVWKWGTRLLKAGQWLARLRRMVG